MFLTDSPLKLSSPWLEDGIMQNQIDKVERDDTRDALSEIVKQLVHIPTHGNHLRNPEQSLVPACRKSLSGDESMRSFTVSKHIHRSTPSFKNCMYATSRDVRMTVFLGGLSGAA
jgi:hypothetical protein